MFCSRQCSYIGHRVWNKGLKGTHFSPSTEFKKGHIPWHNGTRGTGVKKQRKWTLEEREKMAEVRRGPKSHLWKGGTSKLSYHIRRIFQYEDWRRSVYERDNYTCQHCGKRGGELQADHIIALSVLLRKYEIKSIEQAIQCKELWDISNGRTLCIPCHTQTETYAKNLVFCG